MNKEVKQQWVDALRSGEYIQGATLLHCINVNTNEHNYCCLGVLCEILNFEKNLVSLEKNFYRQHRYEYGNSGSPRSQYSILDSSLTNSKFLLEGLEADWVMVELKLQGMNDSGQYSFLQIADYIEKNIDVISLSNTR